MGHEGFVLKFGLRRNFLVAGLVGAFVGQQAVRGVLWVVVVSKGFGVDLV